MKSIFWDMIYGIRMRVFVPIHTPPSVVHFIFPSTFYHFRVILLFQWWCDT